MRDLIRNSLTNNDLLLVFFYIFFKPKIPSRPPCDRDKKLRNLELIRQIANENQREATVIQAKFYNARRSSHNYKIGDVVLVRNTVSSNAADHKATGLTPEWRGDYKIVAKQSENVLTLAGKFPCQGP